MSGLIIGLMGFFIGVMTAQAWTLFMLADLFKGRKPNPQLYQTLQIWFVLNVSMLIIATATIIQLT